MSDRYQIGMASYDRLFPNQDTLPRSGFGNLIACPLQGEARRKGNTVFLDESGQPHVDQWAFLASVKRLSAARVKKKKLGERFTDRTGFAVLQKGIKKVYF